MTRRHWPRRWRSTSPPWYPPERTGMIEGGLGKASSGVWLPCGKAVVRFPQRRYRAGTMLWRIPLPRENVRMRSRQFAPLVLSLLLVLGGSAHAQKQESSLLPEEDLSGALLPASPLPVVPCPPEEVPLVE